MRGTAVLERAALDSREERCLFPGSGGHCWGSDGSLGGWGEQLSLGTSRLEPYWRRRLGVHGQGEEHRGGWKPSA